MICQSIEMMLRDRRRCNTVGDTRQACRVNAAAGTSLMILHTWSGAFPTGKLCPKAATCTTGPRLTRQPATLPAARGSYSVGLRRAEQHAMLPTA